MNTKVSPQGNSVILKNKKKKAVEWIVFFKYSTNNSPNYYDYFMFSSKE